MTRCPNCDHSALQEKPGAFVTEMVCTQCGYYEKWRGSSQIAAGVHGTEPLPPYPHTPNWIGWISIFGLLGFWAVYDDGRRNGMTDEGDWEYQDVANYWWKAIGLYIAVMVIFAVFGLTIGAVNESRDYNEAARFAFPGSEARQRADDASLIAGILSLISLVLLPVVILATARFGTLTYRHSYYVGQQKMWEDIEEDE